MKGEISFEAFSWLMPLKLVFISLKTSAKRNDTARDTGKGLGVPIGQGRRFLPHLCCSHLPSGMPNTRMCDHEGLRQQEKVATFSFSVFLGSIHRT